MRIIRIFILLILSIASLESYSQKDIVLLRDGTEMNVKALYLSDEKLYYNDPLPNVREDKTIDRDLIFCIFYEKDGAVFPSPKNSNTPDYHSKNITSKAYMKKDLVIMKDNSIYTFDNVSINKDFIFISTISKTPSGENTYLNMDFPKEEVFIIKYKNGERRIISTFYESKPNQPEKVVVQEEQKEVEEENFDYSSFFDQEPVDEFITLLHISEKGETLASIAEEYKVDVNDLIEWNSLPKKIDTSRQLSPGIQLVIYVKK